MALGWGLRWWRGSVRGSECGQPAPVLQAFCPDVARAGAGCPELCDIVRAAGFGCQHQFGQFLSPEFAEARERCWPVASGVGSGWLPTAGLESI